MVKDRATMMNLARSDSHAWRSATALALLSLASCSDTDTTVFTLNARDVQHGTLRVPLSAVGASGAAYRLEDALLNLVGPEMTSVDLSGAVEVVEAQLRSGAYEATLLDGWSMLRMDETGPQPVAATLLSENPAPVEIVRGTTSELLLRFLVASDGEGADDGTLAVRLEIEEETNAPPAGMEGSPPPDGADECSILTDGVCADVLLPGLLASLGALPGCLPATTVPTALGDAEVCAGATCLDGSAGCPIPNLNLAAAADDLSGDLIELVGSVSLGEAMLVPVTLAAGALGEVACDLNVEAEFTSVVATLETLDAGGALAAGLAVQALTVADADVQVNAVQESALCSAVSEFAAELATDEVAAVLATQIETELSERLESVGCTRCNDEECPLRCRLDDASQAVDR